MTPIYTRPVATLTVPEILQVLITFWLLGVFIVFAINAAANYLGRATDSTDRDAFHRSGVHIVTDHKTGREYLITPEGGITPRLSP